MASVALRGPRAAGASRRAPHLLASRRSRRLRCRAQAPERPGPAGAPKPKAKLTEAQVRSTRLESGITRGVVLAKDRLLRANAVYAVLGLGVGFLLNAFIPHPQSPADVFIAAGIVASSELVNRALYSPLALKNRFVRFLRRRTNLVVIINNLRLGLLFGIIIDGVKVSS